MISKSESRSDVLACDGVQLKLTHEAIEGQRQQHCISLAPARLDRFPRGLPAMSLIPFAPLKLARRPRSLAASRAALPSISLIPCAPLAWHLNEQRRSTTYYAPSIGEKNFKFSKMSIFERLRKE
jgi:hypothetical protein